MVSPRGLVQRSQAHGSNLERRTNMTTSTPSRVGIPTGTWKVDKAHTRVGFAVKSMGVATVRGKFRQFDGGLEISDELADSRAYGRTPPQSTPTRPGATSTCARRTSSPSRAILS